MYHAIASSKTVVFWKWYKILRCNSWVKALTKNLNGRHCELKTVRRERGMNAVLLQQQGTYTHYTQVKEICNTHKNA